MAVYLLREGADGTIYACLATKWELAPDRSYITLTLRKGVKFHDGSDFNASVAKWNLDQLKEGKVSGTNVWTTIDVVDDYTVKVGLSEYSNTIWADLSGGAGRMVSQIAYETNGLDWIRMNPCGTGP